MLTDEEIAELVRTMRRTGGDLQQVEVKASVDKLPRSIAESVSALANGSGGTILLGLSEEDGFAPAPGFDARAVFDALAGVCADKLSPPIRPDMRIAEFEDARIVAASIPETPPMEKPCYIKDRGMYRGSFIRTGDGDRLLSQYEIDRLVEERMQPRHDLEVVGDAAPGDLDGGLVAGAVRRQRDLHPRIFAGLSDTDALLALNVLARGEDGGLHPTLAGLLALGTYPQHFFPRLTVTFTRFPGTDKAPAGGMKFLDSETMAGPIPAVLLDTVAAVRRNMRVGGRLEGSLRHDVCEYPEAAVREAVCNALMHRDYSPLGRGSQVQVNMYADRLEVLSPGGLYGMVTTELLGRVGASSTRNQHLSMLLETTPYGEGGFVAENRGTGFQLIESELHAAGMEPPEVVDRPAYFSLTMRSGAETGVRSGAGDRSRTGRGAAARADLTDRGAAVLACVEELGQARASQVAAATGMPRSTVSYQLKKLLEKHLIEAVPVDDAAGGTTRRVYRAVREEK